MCQEGKANTQCLQSGRKANFRSCCTSCKLRDIPGTTLPVHVYVRTVCLSVPSSKRWLQHGHRSTRYGRTPQQANTSGDNTAVAPSDRQQLCLDTSSLTPNLYWKVLVWKKLGPTLLTEHVLPCLTCLLNPLIPCRAVSWPTITGDHS